MYDKYLIQCENGNFIKLDYLDYDNKILEVQEWDDIAEANLFNKEVAEEHLDHIQNGNGFWAYKVDEDTDIFTMKVKKVTLSVE